MRSPDRTCVLLVEDDPNIVDLVRSNLVARHFEVIVSRDGEGVLTQIETEDPAVVLLDLMLPAVDGFDLARQIREQSSVGIIVVSARRAETDKVRALNLGADDYLTKPFGIDELLARVNATLRRTRPAPPPETTTEASVVTVGDVVVDLGAQRVTRGGSPVHLTPTEFALLREFVTNPGKLLTHATLLRRVWGPGYETQTEYARVYVARLRAKLEGAPGTPRPGGDAESFIVTEPRSGYRFEPLNVTEGHT